MIASERRRFILESLSTKGVISLKDIAADLGVAEITVRRDFEKLESEGKLKRVQGGATSLEDLDGAELTMSQKLPIHMREKEIVAGFAAGLVKEGDCVFIDGGTTMLPLATALMRKRVRIITYNTMILNKVIRPAAQIFLIGGEYRPAYNMNVGPIAQEMLKQFFFDCAFFGCSGIDIGQQMVYTTETESMEIKRIAMENSKRSYLLADNTKFSTKGFLRVCETGRFDSVISDSIQTDEPLPDNLIIVPERKDLNGKR